LPVITDSGRHWGRRAFRKRPGTIHIAIRPPIPAGLRRDALMARLAQELATPLDVVGDPVDNPVGEAVLQFPGHPKQN
jgi:1-acyl-sn-glycerol-3-phosphate acyltransferase